MFSHFLAISLRQQYFSMLNSTPYSTYKDATILIYIHYWAEAMLFNMLVHFFLTCMCTNVKLHAIINMLIEHLM